MALLSKIQAESIAAEVAAAGITLSHLADELTDHICCMVEERMERGDSFEEAYRKAAGEYGVKILQKVQDDTRYVTDKKFRMMKTAMKVSGLIAMILLGLGTAFKILHWPGAGIGLVLGFSTLCAVFLPAAMYVNYREAHQRKHLFLNILALLGGMVLITGVLFKVMHWPGASIELLAGYFILVVLYLPGLLFVKLKQAESGGMKTVFVIGFFAAISLATAFLFKIMHWPGAAVLLLLGAILLVSVFLPVYAWHEFKKEKRITGRFIYMVIASTFLILFTSLISIRVSSNAALNFVQQDVFLQQEKSAIEALNQKWYADWEQNPDNLTSETDSIVKEVKKLTADIRASVSEIKTQLIQSSEDADKENSDCVYHLMIGNNNNGKASWLKSKISIYKENLHVLVNDHPALKKMTDRLLDVSDQAVYQGVIPWEIRQFSDKSLASALAVLSYFDLAFLRIESEALHTLSTSNNQVK